MKLFSASVNERSRMLTKSYSMNHTTWGLNPFENIILLIMIWLKKRTVKKIFFFFKTSPKGRKISMFREYKTIKLKVNY